MLSNRALYAVISGAVILLDQISKLLVRSYIAPGDAIRLFDSNLVWLVFVQNPGSAFGLRIFSPLLLTIISFAAATGLGIFLFRSSALLRWQGIPFAFIMGGAIGNLIDRVILGKVTDFLSIDFPDFIMIRWPVFNVADSSVSVGVVCLIIVSLFSKKPEWENPGSKVELNGGEGLE